MTPQLCAIIPSRNHVQALPAIAARLVAAGLPVIIVDDGSDAPARDALAALHDPAGEIEVIRLPHSHGKGGAVKAGFRRAEVRGFTHALQIDADGQHDLGALPDMLRQARRHPDAIIIGQPIFDASMPLGRRLGRWVTHAWVWIETLSLRIRDSMCGFRVYPLQPVMQLLAAEPVGDRMDFDTEILVRLFWRGVEVRPVAVRVIYPEGNTSNFDLLRDNLLISRMHARLVLGMLGRALTGGVVRRGSAVHWASLSERGLGLGLGMLAQLYRLLGRRACRGVARSVAAYFCLTNGERRRASRAYLARVRTVTPGWRDVLRHYGAFADMAIDRFAAWTAPSTLPPIRFPDRATLDAAMQERRGALLLVSHLGNIDITRAVLHGPLGPRITVLAHTHHARRFTRLIAARNPRFTADVVEVTEVGVETAMLLGERVARGEWIAMAADRTPVSGRERTVSASFLGAPAEFSIGPYLLASLLGCPVYAMFCIAEPDGYRVHLHHFADRIELPRAQRRQALGDWAGRYAALLESHCRAAPEQWFNFYDFWRPATGSPG